MEARSCKMCRYSIFLVFTILLLDSEELRVAAASSDPKIVLDSVRISNDWETGSMSWTKFKDIADNEKDAIFQVVEGGFVFFDVFRVRIHCQAPYPVEWESSENLLDDSERLYVFNQKYTQRNGSLVSGSPDNWSFTAVLQLLMLSPFVSRKYTCRGLTSNSERQANTTVYVSVVGISLIAEAGKKFEINVDGKSTVDLPCRLTYVDDSTEVLLQKKEEKEDLSFTWKLMTLNSSVGYDSRVGFWLSVKDLPAIIGDYRCLVNGTETEEEEAVHFTISNTPTVKTAGDDVSPRMELQGSAKLWWEDYKDKQKQRMFPEMRLICCSNSEKPPKIRLASCSNPGDCREFTQILSEMKKEANMFEPADVGFPTPNCSDTSIYGPIFIVRCEGEGINVLQTYHYTFKNATVPNFKDYGSSRVAFQIKELNLISASIPMKGSEERMIKMVYFKSKKIMRRTYFGGEVSVTVQDPTGLPYDFMYTGTNVTFRCYYSTYAFAIGGYWTVKWKTGDSKLFPGVEEEGLGDYGIFGILDQGTLSLTMKLERELESVACGVSVMNTSEWKFREIKVSVRDPMAPSFKVKEEEIVWTLRSKNVTLECDRSGLPVSDNAKWRKDGKRVSLNDSKLMRIVQTGLKSVLLIPEVSHEMHGEFSCETMNVAGKAVKVFSVYVEEGSGATGWTIFGVTICLVILGGMTYAVWKFGLDNVKKIFAKKLC